MKITLFLFLFLTICYRTSFSQDLLKNKENAHLSEILTVSINNDATFLITGGTDKRLQVWNVSTGEKQKVFAHSTAVTATGFSSNGKTFATGSADGKLIVFDTPDWKIKKILKEHTQSITSLSFNPINNNIVTASKDNTAKIWDGISNNSILTLNEHTKAINAVVYSPDGKNIATGSSDNTIKIWDSKTGQVKTTLSANSKEVTALTWSSDGKYLVSGGSEGVIVIWDVASGKELFQTNFKAKVNSITISPDVQYMAVSGANKKIGIWNIETKQIIKEFDAHEKDINCLVFSDKGGLLISVSNDASLKIWSVASLKIGKKKYVKDAADPKLSLINLNMIDDNHNGIIENPEKPTINFILKNTGKGMAFNVIARISIDNSVIGLRFDKEITIGNLEPDNYTNVSIPLQTDSLLETSAGNFTIEIIEGNGFNLTPYTVNYQSRGGVSYCYVMVASQAYSSATGKAEAGAPITLKLKLKNTSSGIAKNTKISYIFPPGVIAVNKLSEIIPSILPGEEKEISVEFFATKEYIKPKINIGLNLEGAYTNANDQILEVKMNQTLPTTDIVFADNSMQSELPETNLYRGGGDPLSGLNITKSKEMIIGKYYALIIGVNKYKGSWSPLQNAVNDAKAIEALLKIKYKFDNFQTLYDEQATRVAILNKLEWLTENVKENDNVFIYYSGHGEFKKEINKGFWVPIDATTNSLANYISNADLQSYLGGIKSKHTLLVADACFSGDIFRGKTVSVPFEDSEKYYKEVHSLYSRQAMTSGGLEPVMDGGKDGHSVFAYYFLKTLKENESKYFDVGQIYNKIKIPVINNSEQSPRLAPVKNTGDEGGQFLFIKK